jgi:hypothetical protein
MDSGSARLELVPLSRRESDVHHAVVVAVTGSDAAEALGMSIYEAEALETLIDAVEALEKSIYVGEAGEKPLFGGLDVEVEQAEGGTFPHHEDRTYMDSEKPHVDNASPMAPEIRL